MTLTEERLQILKMVEAGQLTAEEAAKLLAAMEAGAEKEQDRGPRPSPPGQPARWLRVRVTDETTGKRKVNVNLPISMVNVAMKVGSKFAPEIKDFDVEEIFAAIQSGAQGKIVEVQDEEEGERVEVFVE